MMKKQNADMRMVEKLLFRLLPVQILLAAVGAVNGIVSSFFATNFVGIDAMSAVGIYSPLHMLITSVSTVLVGGSAILCGTYMGKNQQEKMQNVFSLNLMLSLGIAALFIAVYGSVGLFRLGWIFTRDEAVLAHFHGYILGQVIGTVPLMLGNSFASFLSLENKGRRTIAASLGYIAVNLLLNFVFVQVLRLEAFGLALASSAGMWVFLGIQAEVFLSGKSHFRFRTVRPDWKETAGILRIGLPGAATNLYQTARGLIVNSLVEHFVGSVGISAFSAANNLLTFVWAVPAGMLAVSRLMISVSVGEEDRQTLTDVMRVMFRRFLPLMGGIVLALILAADPLTRIFYRDPASDVFRMTAWGFRILPLCMPLSIICMHFVCYDQTIGRQALVHVMALLDGVVCVAGFTALLIPVFGMNSVYIANVLNGVTIVLLIAGYAWVRNRHIPRNMEELMVIPSGFGVPKEERMDLSVCTTEEVLQVSRQVQAFCLERGVSRRGSYLAGLALEEMAGNVVEHGFTKDRKAHSVDIRVSHKKGGVILRIRDDCVPFDPGERRAMAESEDPAKNIGIRMIFRMAEEIRYQNILGLNVLTIRVGDRASSR